MDDTNKNLKEIIEELLDKYKKEKQEQNSNRLFKSKKSKRDLNSLLSTQISRILINAIEEINSTSGIPKCQITEQLIYTGLQNTDFYR